MCKKKILIIEDNPEVVNVVVSMLQSFDSDHVYTYHSASDGISGLKSIFELRPDLILLDILLSKLSGLEVLKQLRAGEDKKVAGTPVIMLTGQNHPKIVKKSMELGANSYLCKPFDWTDLVHHVVKLI